MSRSSLEEELAATREILSTIPVVSNPQNDYELLMNAVTEHSYASIQELLKNGTSFKQAGPTQQRSPLGIALANADFEAIKLFILYGNDSNYIVEKIIACECLCPFIAALERLSEKEQATIRKKIQPGLTSYLTAAIEKKQIDTETALAFIKQGVLFVDIYKAAQGCNQFEFIHALFLKIESIQQEMFLADLKEKREVNSAIQTNNPQWLHFLLKIKADQTVLQGESAVERALRKNIAIFESESEQSLSDDDRWSLLRVFSEFPAHEEKEKIEYSRAALHAAKHNYFEPALLLIEAGGDIGYFEMNEKQEFYSILHFAVLHDAHEFLHELTSSFFERYLLLLEGQNMLSSLFELMIAKKDVGALLILLNQKVPLMTPLQIMARQSNWELICNLMEQLLESQSVLNVNETLSALFNAIVLHTFATDHNEAIVFMLAKAIECSAVHLEKQLLKKMPNEHILQQLFEIKKSIINKTPTETIMPTLHTVFEHFLDDARPLFVDYFNRFYVQYVVCSESPSQQSVYELCVLLKKIEGNTSDYGLLKTMFISVLAILPEITAPQNIVEKTDALYAQPRRRFGLFSVAESRASAPKELVLSELDMHLRLHKERDPLKANASVMALLTLKRMLTDNPINSKEDLDAIIAQWKNAPSILSKKNNYAALSEIPISSYIPYRPYPSDKQFVDELPGKIFVSDAIASDDESLILDDPYPQKAV